MIISRTPLRVSLFGGGTDLPEYFNDEPGAVLGAAIDKYIYLSVTRFPSALFDYNIRLAYRRVECVDDPDKIEHRPLRELLRHCGIQRDIEINVTADLPSFSGLGSSSSFTVGALKSLHAHLGRHIGAEELARQAIYLEREVLNEAVGCQDQTFAAYGGFNVIEFSGRGRIAVERLVMPAGRLDELNHSLLLYFTGITRKAEDVERSKINNVDAIRSTLRRMRTMVDEAHGILTGTTDLSALGALLDKTWTEKRMLDRSVSNDHINAMYDLGREAGALGGKLLGAGGGGFLLFFVPDERQAAVRSAMKEYHEIPFVLGAPGSSILHA
ncbi:MAG: GHMP kinase [Alphaproteobacteria bacterium]|jgi:D-glycero-alpha-D-manno-heptose-7-phosphate kinase